MIVDAHNVKFWIDTSEWLNSEDAQDCADMIEGQLRCLTEDEAQSLHAGLVNGDDAANELADSIARQCASKILDGYEEQPETGHNYAIMAVLIEL